MSGLSARVIEVCVFRFAHDRPEYLLLRRSTSESLYPGMWQIVTGTLEENEKAYEAALREVQEETGLRPEHFWIVPYTNSFYDRHSDAVILIPFFAAQVPPADDPVLSAEHSAWQWLPYDQALKHLVWPGQRRGVEIVHQYILGGQEAASLIAIPV
ncbi:MAG TPA: NUDIX pyrophosphatase [Bacteroidota bacterium]|nr:NUDIX pyrophosphatase [Bacteroidota bacterium]